jgi:hypothetical protein
MVEKEDGSSYISDGQARQLVINDVYVVRRIPGTSAMILGNETFWNNMRETTIITTGALGSVNLSKRR